MCFVWKLNNCIVCNKYNWSSDNRCNKCRHTLYDCSFVIENGLNFNRHKYLR